MDCWVHGGRGNRGAGVPPPDPINPQKSGEAFRRVALDWGATAVLTSHHYADARQLDVAAPVGTAFDEDWPNALPWHVTSRGASGRGKSAPRAVSEAISEWAPSPQTPALLQYTSGSTSDPKGVVITHGNVVHQAEFNRRFIGLGPGHRAVFWVPPYHDFGLISGILSAWPAISTSP